MHLPSFFLDDDKRFGLSVDPPILADRKSIQHFAPRLSHLISLGYLTLTYRGFSGNQHCQMIQILLHDIFQNEKFSFSHQSLATNIFLVYILPFVQQPLRQYQDNIQLPPTFNSNEGPLVSSAHSVVAPFMRCFRFYL